VQVLWWIALGVYCACMVFAILWNIFYYWLYMVYVGLMGVMIVAMWWWHIECVIIWLNYVFVVRLAMQIFKPCRKVDHFLRKRVSLYFRLGLYLKFSFIAYNSLIRIIRISRWITSSN
jgi:hypothetical protein